MAQAVALLEAQLQDIEYKIDNRTVEAGTNANERVAFAEAVFKRIKTVMGAVGALWIDLLLKHNFQAHR